MKKFVVVIPLVFLLGGLVGAEVSTTDPSFGGHEGTLLAGDGNIDNPTGMDGFGDTMEGIMIEDVILDLVSPDVQQYIASLEGMSFVELLDLWRLNHLPPTEDDRIPPKTEDLLNRLKNKKKHVIVIDPPNKNHDGIDGGGVLAGNDQELIGTIIVGEDENILPGDENYDADEGSDASVFDDIDTGSGGGLGGGMGGSGSGRPPGMG